MLQKIFLILLLIPIISWAAPAPENVFTGNCLSSYQGSYKTAKKNKVFVYAREKDTGKARCSWQYGNDDLKVAKRKALNSCAKHNLNAECLYVDINGEYLVKDGDFSLVTQPDKTPMSDELKQALTDEAKILLQGSCFPFFKKFLKNKEHRAFSYSMDPNGNNACGSSYGSNMQSVLKNAIKFCKSSKRKRGKKAPKSECKIYAKNREILLKASDYGVEIIPKSDKYLDDEEYKTYLTQAKNTINEGPCLFQFKYYLRGSQHQAFYLAKDSEGKQACGREEDAFTPDIAKKRALEKCKKNVKKNGIKASCELYSQNFEIGSVGENTNTQEKAEVGKELDLQEAKIEELEKKEVVKEIVIDKEADYKQAIYKGSLAKIKKYISEGANVNEVSKDGISPIFIAAGKGDEEYFLELVDKGANIKQEANNGGSLLFAAVAGGNTKIVNYLLDKGFNINEQSLGDNTPLHLALFRSNIDIAKLLIKSGADANIKNAEGKSGFDIGQELKLNLDEFKK